VEKSNRQVIRHFEDDILNIHNKAPCGDIGDKYKGSLLSFALFTIHKNS